MNLSRTLHLTRISGFLLAVSLLFGSSVAHSSRENEVTYIQTVYSKLSVGQNETLRDSSKMSQVVKSYYDFNVFFQEVSQDFRERLTPSQYENLRVLFS